jgi:outer membrane lipoprotein-sorting protein
MSETAACPCTNTTTKIENKVRSLLLKKLYSRKNYDFLAEYVKEKEEIKYCTVVVFKYTQHTKAVVFQPINFVSLKPIRVTLFHLSFKTTASLLHNEHNKLNTKLSRKFNNRHEAIKSVHERE